MGDHRTDRFQTSKDIDPDCTMTVCTPWRVTTFRWILSFFILISFPTLLAAQQGMEAPTPEPIESPDEVSDVELEQFAISSDRIGAVQQEAREKIVEAVEQSGLGMDRFMELAASFNDPSMTLENELTAEEQRILDQLEPRMVQIELDAREQVFVQLAQEGMNVGRYQQIYHALQSFPSLQERMNRVAEQDEQP